MIKNSYTEIIRKLQQEIEDIRGLSPKEIENYYRNKNYHTQNYDKNANKIIKKLSNEKRNLQNEIEELKIENRELKDENIYLHSSFMTLENNLLKLEIKELKKRFGISEQIRESTTLLTKETINAKDEENKSNQKETKPKKKKPNKSYKRTWGLNGNEYKQLREEIITRANGKCEICGASGKHIHHIKQRQHGGTNEPYNLMYLCAKCHAERHKNDNVYNIMIKHI